MMDEIELNSCDKCGARAQLMVLFESGLDLAFCGHHGYEYADKLPDNAVVISPNKGRPKHSVPPS